MDCASPEIDDQGVIYQGGLMTTADQIKAALDGIREQIERKQGETEVRLLTVEQTIAGAAPYARWEAAGGLSCGARALEDLAENDQFQAAVNAVQRGGKPSAFASRVNIDSSIRAALVGDGWSSSGASSTVPSVPEHAGMVGQVIRPLSLLDVLPRRSVTSDAVEHIRLSTEDEADYQAEHGAEKKELDFDGQLVRAEIATIAGWSAASKQVLADHVSLQATIDRTIRGKVLAKLERELIQGAGGPGEIQGLWSLATWFVPSIDVEAENRADRIGAAVAAMDAAGYRPSIIVLHPSDWFALLTTKRSDYSYLFGSPAAPLAPSLWSRSVVTSSALDRGSALVIDPTHVTLLDREQLTVQVSNQHADFFTRNLVAILGELRAGLEVNDSAAVLKLDFDGLTISEP